MRAVKVFEAKTLIESMEDRSQNYDDLREKLQHLKKKFTDIVQLDDALQGKGATAIKGFYQGQIDVVEAWLRLIDRNIAFFNGISGMTEDVDLSGNTTVYLPFLEDELSHHETSYSAMVTSQQEELQTISNRIDDLVPLNVFSMDRFNDQLAQAQKKRRSTIQAVESLDADLKTEYMLSENDEYYAVTLFQQLIEATRQGGNTISPIHFNAEAYKSSDVYKLKEQAEKQAIDYIAYKNKQEEARDLQVEKSQNKTVNDITEKNKLKTDDNYYIAGQTEQVNDHFKVSGGAGYYKNDWMGLDKFKSGSNQLGGKSETSLIHGGIDFDTDIIDGKGGIDILNGTASAQIGGESIFGLKLFLPLVKAEGIAYQLQGRTQIDRKTPYVGEIFGGTGIEGKGTMGNAKAYAGFDKSSVGFAAKAAVVEGEVNPIIGIPFTETEVKLTFGMSGGSIGGEAKVGKETILDLRFIIGIKVGISFE
ncbi:hypothetical protein JOC75_003199 [Metabacillus crassostreae]|uniref:LXG domain-containing protein n=1 Tax=Metabacillus crassostreae TaxID=929098 RepID=UPI001956A5FE|nr:LXG domain-containing protein [Metabacillus crassostreae]MBM7605176.1 hypothetical protein [Metabacillus crassostreae]